MIGYAVNVPRIYIYRCSKASLHILCDFNLRIKIREKQHGRFEGSNEEAEESIEGAGWIHKGAMAVGKSLR